MQVLFALRQGTSVQQGTSYTSDLHTEYSVAEEDSNDEREEA